VQDPAGYKDEKKGIKPKLGVDNYCYNHLEFMYISIGAIAFVVRWLL
jgi:hypothetical protein